MTLYIVSRLGEACCHLCLAVANTLPAKQQKAK